MDTCKIETPGEQYHSPSHQQTVVDGSQGCYGSKSIRSVGTDGKLSRPGEGEVDNPLTTVPVTVQEGLVTAQPLSAKSISPVLPSGSTDENSAKYDDLTEHKRSQNHQKKPKNKKEKQTGEKTGRPGTSNRNIKTNSGGIKFLEPRHNDHDISTDVFQHIIETIDLTGYGLGKKFTLVVGIPSEIGTVTCSLYGPDSGDAPVNEERVEYIERGSERKNKSRMIHKPLRKANKAVVIGKTSKNGTDAHAVDTIFGSLSGNIPPFEVNPWMRRGNEEYQRSMEFWKTHALATGKEDRDSSKT